MGKARKKLLKLLKVLLVVATMVAVLSFSITAFATGTTATISDIPSNEDSSGTAYQYVNLTGTGIWQPADTPGDTYFDFGQDKSGADGLFIGNGDIVYVNKTLGIDITVNTGGTVYNSKNNTVVGSGGTLNVTGGNTTTGCGNFAAINVKWPATLEVTAETTVTGDITGNGTVDVDDGVKLSFNNGADIFQPVVGASFRPVTKEVGSTFTNLTGAWTMEGNLTVNGGTPTITGNKNYGMTIGSAATVKCDPTSNFKCVVVSGTVDLAGATIDNYNADENRGYGLYVSEGSTVSATGEREISTLSGVNGGIYVADGKITDFHNYNVKATASGNALHVVNGTVELTDCDLSNLLGDNGDIPVVLCDEGTTTIGGGSIGSADCANIAAQLNAGTLNLTDGVKVVSSHPRQAILVNYGTLNVGGTDTNIIAYSKMGIRALGAGATVNFVDGAMKVQGIVDNSNCGGIVAYDATASVNISGGVINVNNIAFNSKAYGVYAINGNVKISGGEVKVVGYGSNAQLYGVFADNASATISGGAINVNSQADNSQAYGAYASNGELVISNGTINVNGKDTILGNYLFGIYNMDGKFVFKEDAKLVVDTKKSTECKATGVYTHSSGADKNLIEGGTITVNADDAKGIVINGEAVVVDFIDGKMEIGNKNGVGVNLNAENAAFNFTGGEIYLSGNNSYGVNVEKGNFVMGTPGSTNSIIGATPGAGYPYIFMDQANVSHGVYVKGGTSRLYNGLVTVEGGGSSAIYVAGGDVQVLTNLATPKFNIVESQVPKVVFATAAYGKNSCGFYVCGSGDFAIRGQGSAFGGETGLYVDNSNVYGDAEIKPISGGSFISYDNGNAIEVGIGNVDNLLLANHYVRNDVALRETIRESQTYSLPTNGKDGVDANVSALTTTKAAGPYTVVDGEWELREAMERNHTDADLNNYTMPVNIILDANAGKGIHGIYAAAGGVEVEAGAADGHKLDLNGFALVGTNVYVVRVCQNATLLTVSNTLFGTIRRSGDSYDGGYAIAVDQDATYNNGVLATVEPDVEGKDNNGVLASAEPDVEGKEGAMILGIHPAADGIWNEGTVNLNSGFVGSIGARGIWNRGTLNVMNAMVAGGSVGIYQDGSDIEGKENMAITKVWGGNIISKGDGIDGDTTPNYSVQILAGDMIVNGGVIGAGPVDGASGRNQQLAATMKYAMNEDVLNAGTVGIRFESQLVPKTGSAATSASDKYGKLIIKGGGIYGNGEDGIAIQQTNGLVNILGGTIKGDYNDESAVGTANPVYQKVAFQMDGKDAKAILRGSKNLQPLVLGSVEVKQGVGEMRVGDFAKTGEAEILPTVISGNLMVDDKNEENLGYFHLHGGIVNGQTTLKGYGKLIADSGELMGNLALSENSRTVFMRSVVVADPVARADAKAELGQIGAEVGNLMSLPVVRGTTKIKDNAQFYVQDGKFNIVEADMLPGDDNAVPDVQLHGGMYSKIANITDSSIINYKELGADLSAANLVPLNHYLVFGTADGDAFVADKDGNNPRMDQSSLTAGAGKKIGVVYAGDEIRTELAKGNYTLPCNMDLGERGACARPKGFKDVDFSCGSFKEGTLEVASGSQHLKPNGYTLTYTGAAAENPVILIDGGDLTIDSSHDMSMMGGIMAGANNALKITDGSLQLNGVRLSSAGNSALQIDGGTTRIAKCMMGGLNGVNISEAAANAKLTIDSGVFISYRDALNVASGNVVLNGGSFIYVGWLGSNEKSAEVAALVGNDVSEVAKVAALAGKSAPTEYFGLAVTGKDSRVVINGGTFSGIKNEGSKVGALIASNHSVWDNTNRDGTKDHNGTSEVVAEPFLNASEELGMVATYDADKDPATPATEYKACYTVVDNGGGGSGSGSGTPITPTPTPKPSLDTENHFAYILGNADGTFNPDGSLTRSQASAIFYRLLQDKTYTGNVAFKDVGFEYWAHKEIVALANKNILAGYADGKFNPEGKITRAELCAMASRFFSLAAGEISYTDVPKEHWAYKFIASAAAKGWVDAGATTFRPNDYITRGEAVCIINKMLNRSADKAYVDKNLAASFPDVAKTSYYYYDVMEAAHGHLYTIKDNLETWTELK